MTTLLHAHAGEPSDVWHLIYKEVLLHGILDTLKIMLFLFLTYLIMELIEHKASDKTRLVLMRSGKFGPLLGGLVGLVPQCGFSASASNFYTGRVITLGTLIAIFLSTSDEMLPILISGSVPTGAIFAILGYKATCAIFIGFIIDITMRLMKIKKEEINIDEICDEDGCHCERGIFFSALHHTLTVSAFVFVITLLINSLVLFVGEDDIASIVYDRPVISHLIASFLGLIPNCAVSVALTDFCVEGMITPGTMLAGLFSGAGVGTLVLFRVNKKIKENLLILGILVICGTVFGLVADLLNFSALF